MNKYGSSQIRQCIKSNQDNEYYLRLKIQGENEGTKWLNITDEQAEKIAEILEG